MVDTITTPTVRELETTTDYGKFEIEFKDQAEAAQVLDLVRMANVQNHQPLTGEELRFIARHGGALARQRVGERVEPLAEAGGQDAAPERQAVAARDTAEAHRIMPDLGEGDRYHRRNIFERDFRYVGAAAGPHSVHGGVVVTDFASSFREATGRTAGL